jgi:hypothetical protein
LSAVSFFSDVYVHWSFLMRQTYGKISLAGILISIFALYASFVLADSRTWTSIDGQFAVDAEVVTLQDGMVLLRRASDGLEISVPVDQLCREDQDYLVDFSESEGAGDLLPNGRTWTSIDGQFTVEADIIDRIGDYIRLRRASDEQEISVSVSQLSLEDQAYLNDVEAEEENEANASRVRLASNTRRINPSGEVRCELELTPITLGELQSPLGYSFAQETSLQFDPKPTNSEVGFKSLVTVEPDNYPTPNPVRGVARFGDRQYGYVLTSSSSDAASPAERLFDLLLFDLDGDGDLTNETVILGEQTGKGATIFPPVMIKISRDDVACDYAFYLTTKTTERNVLTNGPEPLKYRSVSASFYPAVRYEGMLRASGRPIPFVLLDADSNGRFDDALSTKLLQGRPNMETADRLVPKNEALGSLPPLTFPGYALSATMIIGDAAYSAAFSPEGDELILTPLDSPTGSVRGRGGGALSGVVVHEQYGPVEIKGCSASHGARLPVGQWRLLGGSFAADRKNMVLLSSNSSTETFEVLGDDATPLPYGAPFYGYANCSAKSFTPGQSVRFSLGMRGAGGETCSEFKVDGRRPPGPELLIQTSRGERVLIDRFKYG